MAYQVKKVADGEYRLVGPNGNEIAQYSEQPDIPAEIAPDIADSFGLSEPLRSVVVMALGGEKFEYRDETEQ